MKLTKKIRVPLILILSLLLCVAFTGCSLGKDTAKSGQLKSDSLKLSSFNPLKNDVVKTLYEKTPGSENKINVSGTYDLNGDGKDDTIGFSFTSTDDLGKSVLKVNGKSITTDSFMAPFGVYVVDLNHKDKSKELAITDFETDDDIYTFFYRYDDGLKLIGKLYGGISEYTNKDDKALSLYNSAIYTNKEGLLIPRFGIMEFTKPQIITTVNQYENNAFKELSLDMTDVYQRPYKLSMDIEPYFEEMATIPAKFIPNFNQSDVITLKKGDSLRFQKISNSLGDSYSSFVTLANGKSGMLYFFMHP